MWWKVPGGKSEKVLLTMLFRNCNLMLIFLMDADRRDNVKEVFQWLHRHLGAALYEKLFDLCHLERIPSNQVILKPSLLKK